MNEIDTLLLEHLEEDILAVLMRSPRVPRCMVETINPPPRCVVKECGCGETYDQEQWQELPLLGAMPDGVGGTLELRNCGCLSTLAVEVMS